MLKNKIPFLCTLLSTLPSFLLFCEEIILFINNSLQCGDCLFFYCLASHYSLGNSFTVQISWGFILSETQQKETLQAIRLRACELMLTVRDARSLAFPPVFWLRRGPIKAPVWHLKDPCVLLWWPEFQKSFWPVSCWMYLPLQVVFVWTQSFCFSLLLH